MVNDQKKLLSSANSKLGKADLSAILRKEGAWNTLAEHTRREIYMLLPEPRASEPDHNVDVNPLDTRYRPYIEEEARIFLLDLKDGKEGKKWRDNAIEAGAELRAGKFDEWAAMDKDEKWGAIPDEKDNDIISEEEDIEKSSQSMIMNASQGLSTRIETDSTNKSEAINDQVELVDGAATEHVQGLIENQKK
ncbi:Hypothetical protein R9X50_00635800 [Acrodontium crateriforme]|uniref:ASX DEUBAD domain-containing protein n=1 Tax=Acrodontium crateriforme TaxID=150365 RepID=A0AAQ3RDK6_9PEZI|nr:Hypothetical protein R9X50_00635800 [Acrodontium crateriforme]